MVAPGHNIQWEFHCHHITFIGFVMVLSLDVQHIVRGFDVAPNGTLILSEAFCELANPVCAAAQLLNNGFY